MGVVTRPLREAVSYGAMKLSNNTAEMQTPVDELLCILAQVEENTPHYRARRTKCYPLGLTLRGGPGQTRHGGKTKFLLIGFLIHLWKKDKRFFDFRILWLMGHSLDWGSELADKYAGEGAEAVDELHIGTARPSDWGFSEFRRDYPQHFGGSQQMALHMFDGASQNIPERRSIASQSEKGECGGRPRPNKMQRSGAVRRRNQAG